MVQSNLVNVLLPNAHERDGTKCTYQNLLFTLNKYDMSLVILKMKERVRAGWIPNPTSWTWCIRFYNSDPFASLANDGS